MPPSNDAEQPPRRVVVLDHDPSWPERFEALREHLWPHVRDVATCIEHVGSTSVPGLAAKPILDVDIVAPTVEATQACIARLAPLGYAHRGDLGIAHRHAFSRPPQTFAHNLYVCLQGSVALRNHLVLRDHLREHQGDRLRYDRLKRELARRYPDDIDAYVEGKTALITSLLALHDFDHDELEAVIQANRCDARQDTT